MEFKTLQQLMNRLADESVASSSQSSYAGRMAKPFAPVVSYNPYRLKDGKNSVQKQECKTNFNVMVGTVMENQDASLYMAAAMYISRSQKGIVLSACERSWVTQKTAWFILHRLAYHDLMMAQAKWERC